MIDIQYSITNLSDDAQNFDSISPELVYEGTHIYDRQFHNCGSTLIYMIDNSSRVHKFTNSNQVHKLRPHHKSMAHHKSIADHKSMAHHSLGHITV